MPCINVPRRKVRPGPKFEVVRGFRLAMKQYDPALKRLAGK